MHVETRPVADRVGKPGKPAEMVGRNVSGGADAVAAERGVPAIVEPEDLVLALSGTQQHVLMVAAQTDDLLGCARLGLHQQFHDIAAAAAAVDIVADEDEAEIVVPAMVSALPEEVGELGKGAVNVANRISQECHALLPRDAHHMTAHFGKISATANTHGDQSLSLTYVTHLC